MKISNIVYIFSNHKQVFLNWWNITIYHFVNFYHQHLQVSLINWHGRYPPISNNRGLKRCKKIKKGGTWKMLVSKGESWEFFSCLAGGHGVLGPFLVVAVPLLLAMIDNCGLPAVFENHSLWYPKWTFMSVCSDHVTYAFQSESTLYSCLNVKELLARNSSLLIMRSAIELTLPVTLFNFPVECSVPCSSVL